MRINWKIFLLAVTAHNVAFSQRIDTSHIDSLLLKKYNEKIFNGVVLISKDDSVIFEKSYGYENLALRKPFTANSRFQIASVSKQFTAFGILLLQEQKKLNVKDPVRRYLPDFPFETITIHHLLTHTSGLPNFVNLMMKDLDTAKINGNSQMLEMLATGKYPMQWPAGEKWEYSDIGYCTLATLIEKVSNQRFDVYMKENLFKPAGMVNTTAEMYTDYRRLNQQNLSLGYISDTARKKIDIAFELPEYRFVYYLGGFYGDGSVVTTIDDLLKWDKALYTGKIISKESIALAMTPALLNNREELRAWGTGYGYGWFLYNDGVVGKVQTHSGGHPGYSSRFSRCPEKKITVIVLSNFTVAKFGELDILKEIIRLENIKSKM
jgi:CubicO group peptidase (beta-lactamase class C family)